MATFDAAPLVAALLAEPGGIVSGRMLADSGHTICALNAAEVVDSVARTRGVAAEAVAAKIQIWIEAGLRVVPLDWARAERAEELEFLGEVKGSIGRTDDLCTAVVPALEA